MNFELSKEHQELREMFREFAQMEVKPIAKDLDEKERFPRLSHKISPLDSSDTGTST